MVDRTRTMTQVLGKIVELIRSEWPNAKEVTSVATAGIGALHLFVVGSDQGLYDVSIVVTRRQP